ncbi:hypothetical protein KY362_00595 [Candidatus Woesearchaeota archaeon]|nr:hypothetical protein [Candidatus Woesearchaeota archaeon]
MSRTLVFRSAVMALMLASGGCAVRAELRGAEDAARALQQEAEPQTTLQLLGMDSLQQETAQYVPGQRRCEEDAYPTMECYLQHFIPEDVPEDQEDLSEYNHIDDSFNPCQQADMEVIDISDMAAGMMAECRSPASVREAVAERYAALEACYQDSEEEGCPEIPQSSVEQGRSDITEILRNYDSEYQTRCEDVD